MGFKTWRYLSLLAFTGAVLAGCNSTNPREKQGYIESKGPPGSPQSAQRPPAFPGTANANPPAFPQANNQQKSPFAQTSGGNTPNPFGQVPTTPPTPSPFPQNQGNPVSQPSQSFAPPPLQTFPPLPGSSTPLPGSVVNTPFLQDSKIFQGSPPAPPTNTNNFPR